MTELSETIRVENGAVIEQDNVLQRISQEE
jgi:hypothetical protein